MALQTDPERNEIKYLNQFSNFTNKWVIEIGCGEGRLTWQYATRARFTMGIDLDADALRVGTIDRPSDLTNIVLFSQAESEHLPFRKETFDIALLAWSL